MAGANAYRPSPPLPGDWTILHRLDPAMDLHLKLMTEAAEEALRGVRASEEFAARRAPEPAPPVPSGLARRLRRLLWPGEAPSPFGKPRTVKPPSS